MNEEINTAKKVGRDNDNAANSTAIVLSGCRTPSDAKSYYCVCPILNDPIGKMSTSTASSHVEDRGLSSGKVAGIVIGCLIFVALLMVAGFILFRKLKERRKNHGEYRPQYEETHQAKDLPYLPPPNIEGLI